MQDKETDSAGFLILVARCDPLHNHSHPFLSMGYFCQTRAKPFVHVQGTVKPFGADRYWCNSREEWLWGVWGRVCVQRSVSSRLPQGREHPWDVGTSEKQEIVFFPPLGSPELSYLQYIPCTQPNTCFSPSHSLFMLPLPLKCLSSSSFYQSSTAPCPLLSHGS